MGHNMTAPNASAEHGACPMDSSVVAGERGLEGARLPAIFTAPEHSQADGNARAADRAATHLEGAQHTPEMLALARKAMDARKDENIEEWAQRLAEDACQPDAIGNTQEEADRLRAADNASTERGQK